ncbi:hypothetical protein F4777DRAFT_300010 [Nemania sp. FL0916]|nr:hypothetical protein F4777DRAFT_300010 [Nemania sp. FL0916]
MSASPPYISGASSNITYITAEAFEPKPLIADILRTRFCVPDSIFLVEGVDIAHTSKSKRWRAIRLMLGDGELCIQALLSAEMHRFVDRGEVCFGSYVKLQQFRVEWREIARGSTTSPRKHGRDDEKDKSQMVYLVVDSLVLVGWNNTLTDLSAAEEETPEPEPDYIEVEAEDEVREEKPSTQNHAPEPSSTHPPTAPAASQPLVIEPKDPLDIDDDFEVMAVPESKTAHNRSEVAAAIVHHKHGNSITTTNLPWSINDPTRPLKLTKLRSIPNLPFAQNWSVNVLCIISALSAVEPAGIPPYTQRQAHLADPSTSKHVLLTVFLDPEDFAPEVGSVVLLFGVKNHRFDGGSLKKYASDKPKEGGWWWYENPTRFKWCDVEGLRRWWAGQQVGTPV